MDNGETEIPAPQVVAFLSNEISCKAFVSFGERTLNMRSCLINLGKSPKVNIDYLPGLTRVTINDGAVWFDTDQVSAAKIEALFETGIAP